MSHRTSAEVVADSVTPHGDATRLTSIYVIFPKMILGERNRHRAFSLSDRSSRAVPPEKLIAEVRNDPAMPAKFAHYYAAGDVDPIEFGRQHGLNYMEVAIIKYITRWRKPGGGWTKSLEKISYFAGRLKAEAENGLHGGEPKA